MKKIYFLILFCSIFFTHLGAQILDPVKWDSKLMKNERNDYFIVFRGTIEPGWAVYSQHLDGDEGPIPTSINPEGGTFEIVDNENNKECGHIKKKMDPVFGVEIQKFEEEAIITVPIKIPSGVEEVTGFITFMTCNDKTCLSPKDVDFSFSVLDAESGFTVEDACAGKYFAKVEKKKKDEGLLNPDIYLLRYVQVRDGIYDVILDVEFEEGWHTYSIHTGLDDGPRVSILYIDSTEYVQNAAELKEESTELVKKFDPQFETELVTLGGETQFVQRIRVADTTKEITGYYEYQVCDERQCLPPHYKEFKFTIGDLKDGLIDKEIIVEAEENVDLTKNRGEGTPVYYEFDYTDHKYNCDDSTASREVDAGSSFWWIFGAGFLGGLIALLTPCVFPMIPLTVSFFTKSKKSGLFNAIMYGLSIIVIYLLLGLLITGIAGPEALNQLSTNAYFNIFFFILFVVFAFSFFGYFELTLPSSWVNSSDKAADKGGLVGIFFMAFTLALVSFSCTGPIIGTLLVEAATGGGPTLFGYLPAGPLVGMFGFSLALAMPFALFAAFPSWLNSLPKSGSWMNAVKVTLGFVEIALAFKFLSVADLTMGWNILPYELFIAIWVLCSIGLALYYFGKLKFPHDSPIKKLSIGRMVLGIVAMVLAIYFASGFRYSDRSKTFITPTMMSGLAPPAGHSYIYPMKCPLGLSCYKDFEEGMAYAKEVNKPVLIDFTGHGCVNCRKMEDQVWSQDDIFKILNEEYVLISLYADERTELEEPYISVFDDEEKDNIGKKWSDFQAIHFNRNAQPYYVLVSNEGKVLNQPTAYTPDKNQFKNWLQCGLERNKLVSGQN